jgi:hypothetical protein
MINNYTNSADETANHICEGEYGFGESVRLRECTTVVTDLDPSLDQHARVFTSKTSWQQLAPVWWMLWVKTRWSEGRARVLCETW